MHPLLGGVVEPVLDESHEFCIATCPAVFGIERDDEIRDEAEPLLYLHLCSGAGPFAHGALRLSLFALADDAAALAAVLNRGLEKSDLGMCKVSVLLDVERRRRIEENRLYPFWHIFGGNEGQGVIFSKCEIGGCGLKAPRPQSGSSALPLMVSSCVCRPDGGRDVRFPIFSGLGQE
ncbi:hypothetical protein FB005_14316 [Sinorhizobium medicae]|nr:hypothetical protein FB006_14410 [Sinorhizobium medicae]TWA33982.1 hypothetical protein FB005_14316 [Sinorhizobium medicae]